MPFQEIAAQIETSSGVSEMSVGFRCLSEDLKEVMPLFFEGQQISMMHYILHSHMHFSQFHLIYSYKMVNLILLQKFAPQLVIDPNN
jgi:hypothetical protein